MCSWLYAVRLGGNCGRQVWAVAADQPTRKVGNSDHLRLVCRFDPLAEFDDLLQHLRMRMARRSLEARGHASSPDTALNIRRRGGRPYHSFLSEPTPATEPSMQQPKP